ncbi:translation initiation factor IF-2 [Candidatus Woesearchaeota archaeon]|nr:translation initiation factor IF-2 [Candidatus Woesearchaeota archaeon]
MPLRQVIVTFVGHIDHGKSSILDKIRDTAIVASEAGGITQAIGASIIPQSTIKKICNHLLNFFKMEIKIQGILAIDTPGHAAFSNIRKRGGNLADIAVLVIDINEGIKPQTLECIDILKQYKTPFVIALNKIDLLPLWSSKPSLILLDNIKGQNENTMLLLEKRLYDIVGKLSELSFSAERFDRVEDFTKQVAIIPLSAKTGEGLPELLMVITGLSQRFLENDLRVDIKGYAKGVVLEVKEEKGLGICVDAIIYDGSLKRNDVIVIGTLDEPLVTKVKTLLEPTPLSEMRDKKAKFILVNEVKAATGVKISAPELDKVVAGMPLRSCSMNNVLNVKEEIKEEVEEVLIDTDKKGIVIKADTLGSLEAIAKILKEKNIEIKKASIGNIIKKDISDAEANYEKDPLECVILGFNVALMPEVKVPQNVKVICNNIIYQLIEDFEKWKEEEMKKLEAKEIQFIHRPCKIQIMKGYVFRQNNPAIVGVDVLAGTLKVGTPLMKNEGIPITEAKSIQQEQENIDKAEKGKQVAVSMPNVTIGRQLHEENILYSAIPEEHFKKFKKFKKYLTQDEIEILKEIAEIMRKDNPMWGV